MSGTPLVSVVVPVFNGERFLAASLESILAQSYSNLEVLVLDDASDDRSAEIAEQFAARDPRVTVHSRAVNVGQFPNVNAGIALARGELIAVYHADDVYRPEIVARQVEFMLRHPDAGAAFALVGFIDSEGRDAGRLAPLPPEIATAELMTYPVVINALLRYECSFLPTPTSLVRREVYEEVGAYSSDYGLRGDLDMWLRVARCRPLGIVQEYLASYRVGHENESHRYGYLRTEPELFFALMDDRLAAGDRALADPSALAAFEANRSADRLLVAANTYALGRRAELRAELRPVQPFRIAVSGRSRRWRLLALWLLLQVLARLPWSEAIALRFRRRWHEPPKRPRGSAQAPIALPKGSTSP